MSKIGRRLEPPEGVKLKVGDKVVFEVIYDDGHIGTMTTFYEKFDEECRTTKEQIRIIDND